MIDAMHTDAASMADALRALADAMDKTPVGELPPVWLQVSLQVVSHPRPDDPARRVAAVDALAAHLDLGAPYVGASGKVYHVQRDMPGVTVDVYTKAGAAE